MKSEKEVLCERCGCPLSQCECRCPYCGETTLCNCCTGYSVATGG